MDVDFRGINPKDLLNDADDDREGLIDFPCGDVCWLQTCLLQSNRKRDSRGLREVSWLHTSVGICYIHVNTSNIKSTCAGYSQMTLAKGLTPSSFAFSADIRMRAEAPSLMLDELAAVIQPPCLNADLSVGIFS